MGASMGFLRCMVSTVARLIIAFIVIAIIAFVFGWLISELAANEAVTDYISQRAGQFLR